MATESYKFNGTKTPGEVVNRLVLEGSSTNPARYVEVGSTIELTDEEVKDLRSRNFNLTKASDDSEESRSSQEPQSKTEQAAAQAATSGNPGAQPATKSK